MCWFYAIDNKSRHPDDPTKPTDPVFVEIRAALSQIVKNDQRTVLGLDGRPTRYLQFRMPIRAVEMLNSLSKNHTNVCSMDDVTREARWFGFDDPIHVELLTQMFHNLGMLLHFPHVTGCEHFVILKVQWVINAMAAIIREEELHGSLLEDLQKDEGANNIPELTWKPEDIQHGWFPVRLLHYIWGHETKYNKLAATPQALEALEKLLVHFHMVYEMMRGNERFFVVPALVPAVAPLPAPPMITGTGRKRDIPITMAWQVLRIQQTSHTPVKIFDFKLDFTRMGFLSENLFERLTCAVTAKLSSSLLVKGQVDFYRCEATFAFGELYIVATLLPLCIHVYYINRDAHNNIDMPLEVFLECAFQLVSKEEMYDVLLGYPVQEAPYVHYADMFSANYEIQQIWLKGRLLGLSDANGHESWWEEKCGNGTGRLELKSQESADNRFSCQMESGDFMSCANQLVVDVVPSLLRNLFEEAWRVRYQEQPATVRDWLDPEQCRKVLAYGIGGSPANHAIKQPMICRKALSGRLEILDTTAWGYILLQSAHDPEAQGLGLMHELIADAGLQAAITNRIKLVVQMTYQVRSVHGNQMSLAKLAKMINDVVLCAETIRDVFSYLATSAPQVCRNARIRR